MCMCGVDVWIFMLLLIFEFMCVEFDEGDVVCVCLWVVFVLCDFGGFGVFLLFCEMVEWVDVLYFYFLWLYVDLFYLFGCVC